MKRKGFTLIELLAVIVVLAIIALIATPIVMNVIKNANMGAAERSADNYLKAVDLLISTEKLDGNAVADGTYEIGIDGDLSFGTVEVSGNKPVGGKIVVKDGQVVKAETKIDYEDYTVTFVNGKAEAGENKNLMTLADCDLVDGTDNTIGAKYSCDLGESEATQDLVLYVLEAGTSSKPATLILEENYDTTTLAWCDQSGDNPYDNVCAADGLAAKLDEIVEEWSKLDKEQIGLPSIEQIMIADGQDTDAYLEFPYLNNEWLYNGASYWTSTPIIDDSDRAFSVFCGSGGCTVYDGDVYLNDSFGVRPAIMLNV